MCLFSCLALTGLLWVSLFVWFLGTGFRCLVFLVVGDLCWLFCGFDLRCLLLHWWFTCVGLILVLFCSVLSGSVCALFVFAVVLFGFGLFVLVALFCCFGYFV